MFVVLGATGHVGSAVAASLIDRGEKIIAVARHADKAAELKARGAEIASVDVHDVEALRAVLKRGRRAFLLNPPAPFDTDTDVEERATVKAILAALDGSGLEKVVGESTMGAQPGERLGDLNVLYDLEQGLKSQPIPAAINRGAYYFTNWDMQLDTVRETGELSTMFPADFVLPMVSPADLGRAAAERLLSSASDTGIRDIEGPERYSSADVAEAFAAALGRPVKAVVTPRSDWVAAFRKMGFSQPAADSYAAMTAATLDGSFPPRANKQKGQIPLRAHVQNLTKS